MKSTFILIFYICFVDLQQDCMYVVEHVSTQLFSA